MEFETWWLLSVPIFFSLGWIAARVDIRHVIADSRTMPRGYFKGLNYLLNDRHDKAIDAFIDILKIDPETIELHFALGNLFRRRGEIERAIRVHQNLLARADLPSESQTQALYELGQDYLKAGLLDRAEETFGKLQGSVFHAEASKALLEIYQREKAWQRAIDAALALQNSGVGSQQKEIAQFYCELAQNALVHTQFDAGVALLEEAIRVDRNNVRASILMGDAFLQKGDVEAALQAWRRVENQNIAYTSLVAQRLVDGYRALGRVQEGINLLKNYLAETPSIDLLEVLFNAVVELDGVDAATQLASEELRRTPTLLGLDKLLEGRLMSTQPQAWTELSMVKNLVHGYAQKLARYQCAHCGFKARQFYWQCPGCSHWETYAPRRTEEQNMKGS